MTKKKIIKRIVIPIVLLVAVVSTICIFAVNKKPKQEIPIATVVNQEIDIEDIIQTDVINLKICPEYNGNYVYKSIKDVSFSEDTSASSEEFAYEYISGYPDKNSFLYFLNKQKLSETKNEIITLVNGKYTKTNNKEKIEEGLYYGNLDKSYVYVENQDGTIEIEDTMYSIELEISHTAYWLEQNITPSSTKIYVREKYIYNEHSSNFLYITYVYEMLTD